MKNLVSTIVLSSWLLLAGAAPAFAHVISGVEEGNANSSFRIGRYALTVDTTGYNGLAGVNLPALGAQPLVTSRFREVACVYFSFDSSFRPVNADSQLTVVVQTVDGSYHACKGESVRHGIAFLFKTPADLAAWNPAIMSGSTVSKGAVVFSGGPTAVVDTIQITGIHVLGHHGSLTPLNSLLKISPDKKFNFEPAYHLPQP